MPVLPLNMLRFNETANAASWFHDDSSSELLETNTTPTWITTGRVIHDALQVSVPQV
jgi:hypothetical protein